MSPTNRGVLLARRPHGPVTEDCFELVERPTPEPGPGEVRTRNLYLSCDPYLRGRMDAAFALGEVVPVRVVAQVEASQHPRWAPGDLVWGFLGWEERSLAPGDGLWPVDPALGPLSYFISVLGMPGLTAWVGMVELGRPAPGDHVLVSSAAGAVGSLAGQLARLAGARVVGTVGTPEKADHIVGRLGYHEAIDHRAAADLRAEVGRAFPAGIDVYFENVGGALLEAVLPNLADHARIPVCGMISGYELTADPGTKGLVNLLAKRATMTGFSIYDHVQHLHAHQRRLAPLLADGTLTYVEDVWEGIDVVPRAFIGMLRGDNLGKRLVKLADPAA